MKSTRETKEQFVNNSSTEKQQDKQISSSKTLLQMNNIRPMLRCAAGPLTLFGAAQVINAVLPRSSDSFDNTTFSNWTSSGLNNSSLLMPGDGNDDEIAAIVVGTVLGAMGLVLILMFAGACFICVYSTVSSYRRSCQDTNDYADKCANIKSIKLDEINSEKVNDKTARKKSKLHLQNIFTKKNRC